MFSVHCPLPYIIQDNDRFSVYNWVSLCWQFPLICSKYFPDLWFYIIAQQREKEGSEYLFGYLVGFGSLEEIESHHICIRQLCNTLFQKQSLPPFTDNHGRMLPQPPALEFSSSSRQSADLLIRKCCTGSIKCPFANSLKGREGRLCPQKNLSMGL